MCTSVPQMDAFNTRMSTSSPRTLGTRTSSSQRPGSGLAFTMAFIILCTGKKLSTDFADSHQIPQQEFRSWFAFELDAAIGLWSYFLLYIFFLLDPGPAFLAKQ